MPRLIDPTSDRPLYRQIADQLRTAIREGRYAEGTPLPSETQLAEMYDVTRMTARQAVDLPRTRAWSAANMAEACSSASGPPCTAWPVTASLAGAANPAAVPMTLK